MKKSNFRREVEQSLLRMKSPPQAGPWAAENYIGAGRSKLQFLNIKIPRVREVFKKGYSFSNEPFQMQLEIWDEIWKGSEIFEALLMPVYWVRTLSEEDFHAHGLRWVDWAPRIDNWAHSDELSSLYARLLEQDPHKYLPIYEDWSRFGHPWLRRQSLVGLLYYSRQRQKVLPYKRLITFVERQMADGDFYVQKAVGWTLRELYNVYPEVTLQFLMKQAAHIPPAGWTAATEKLPLKEKLELKRRRRP